jgi:hypothetical protein
LVRLRIIAALHTACAIFVRFIPITNKNRVSDGAAIKINLQHRSKTYNASLIIDTRSEQ